MDVLNDMLSSHSIAVVGLDGSRRENVRCQFHPPKVIIPDASLDIANGYVLEHTLPNGRTDSYIVEEIQFFPPQFGVTPAFYELRVRKASAPTPHMLPHSIVYNVTGSNARVNIGSTDASVNIAQVEVSTLFERMRASATEIPDSALQTSIIATIDRMENKAGGQEFGTAYQQFIATVADHLTVFGPFLPALAQLFVR
jgi:hypothetical protein